MREGRYGADRVTPLLFLHNPRNGKVAEHCVIRSDFDKKAARGVLLLIIRENIAENCRYDRKKM